MTKRKTWLYALPYGLWLALFVIAPVALIIYQSFFDLGHHLTISNYTTYFQSATYLKMTLNSVWVACLQNECARQ